MKPLNKPKRDEKTPCCPKCGAAVNVIPSRQGGARPSLRNVSILETPVVIAACLPPL